MTYTRERYNASRRPNWSADELRAEFDRVQRGIPHPTVIDVRDFGTSGNGATDDTAAIQKALSAMSHGSTVFFPRGTYRVSPASASDYILKLPSKNGMRIMGDPGATIQVAANAGNYRGVIGFVSAATPDGFFVSDLTVDHNSQNNDLGSLAAYSAQGRYTFSTFAADGAFDRISLSRVTVRNCDSVVSFYFPGADQAAGSVSVYDCEWIDARNYDGDDYDQSFINCRCDYLTVQNCRFRGESWANAPRTAIETHASNQVITGNAITAFQIGANITGISQTGTTFNHVVTDNLFEVSRDGVLIWSQPLSPADATVGFENMIIALNTIRMRPDEFTHSAPAGFRGVGIFGGAEHIEYRRLTIRGNKIVYPADESGDSYTDDSAQNWGAISSYLSLATTAVAANVSITDNEIYSCPMSGVFIDFGAWNGLVVEGNTFVDCGSTQSGSPAFANKCVVYFTGTLVDDCKISRNTFIDTAATTQVTDYIFLRDRGASASLYFLLEDNEFRFASGASIVANADYVGVFSSAVNARIHGELPSATNPRLPLITGGIGSHLTVRDGTVYTKSASATTAWSAEVYASAAPTSGTWKVADRVWSTAPAEGAPLAWICTVAGTPGTWRALGIVPGTAAVGDTDVTLAVGTSATTQLYSSTLTADRTVTLSTTGAVEGDKFRVVRRATADGGFLVNVGSGPLTTLSTAEWCDVEYNGSAWLLVARSELSTVTASPASITADQNNYATLPNDTMRLTSNASRNITGLAGGSAGRELRIINVGSNDIVLQNQNASSTDVNRIITGTGADVTLAADDTAHLWYDGTTARWRIVGNY